MKMPFRPDGDQREDRCGPIENKQEAHRKVLNPLAGFTSASSGYPIFSSATPEGQGFGWDIFRNEGSLIL